MAQRVVIPGISVNPVMLPTNSNKDGYFPGDKMEYEDLVIGFILDERLETYKSIKNWMNDITLNDGRRDQFFSDITIEALTNNHQLNQTFKFYNTFPYSISGGVLDCSIDESTPMSLDCMFKFNKMEIVDNS